MPKIQINPEDRRNTTHCPFPKHKGKPWVEVIEEDRQYVEWLTSYDCDIAISEELYDTLIILLEENPG